MKFKFSQPKKIKFQNVEPEPDSELIDKWLTRVITPLMGIMVLVTIYIAIQVTFTVNNTLESDKRIEPKIKFFVVNNIVDSVFIYEKVTK